MAQAGDVADAEALRRAILNVAKAVNSTAFVVRSLKKRVEEGPTGMSDAELSSAQMEEMLDSAARSLAYALDELEPNSGSA